MEGTAAVQLAGARQGEQGDCREARRGGRGRDAAHGQPV